MCSFFGVSRAAYYAWVKRLDQPDPRQERKAFIQEGYEVSHHTYGYRRITSWIAKKKGVVINHKATLRLMHLMGIQSVVRRKKRHQQGTGKDRAYRYPNILHRDFVAVQPNQKWGTDITFIQTPQGFLYLSVIKDMFDGFIVSYEMSSRNSVGLVIRTLTQALQKEMVAAGLIIQSDQGHQYCSQPYYALLQQYKITPSMSRKGNCLDNAPTENFFSHLKTEAIYTTQLLSFQDARQKIAEYIYFYNYQRIQLKTRQTPFETRCLSS